MPSRNPVHNLAGYSAVTVMALGVTLMAIAYFAHYGAVEIVGVAAMFVGVNSLAIVFLARRRRG
jgi:hypothetical protein